MNEVRPFSRPWWKWPGRYRHTRGFGVHSPLAYRVISEIINSDGSGYYTVAGRSLGNGMSREDYQRVVALICLLRPRSVYTTCPVLDNLIVTDIDSTVGIGPTRPDMIVVTPGCTPCPALLKTCLERGGTVIITDRRPCMDLAADMLMTMDHGISFSGKRMVIAIGRKDLPRQHFELIF